MAAVSSHEQLNLSAIFLMLSLLMATGCQRAEVAETPASENPAPEAVDERKKLDEEIEKRHRAWRNANNAIYPEIRSVEEYWKAVEAGQEYLVSDLSENEYQVVAEELRARYPVISLRDRLAFETREGFAESLTVLKNQPYLKVRVSVGSGRKVPRLYARSRSRALKELHSEEVERFVRDDGFGFDRMHSSGVISLLVPEEFGELTPVPYDSRYYGSSEVALPWGGFDIANIDPREKVPWLMEGMLTRELALALQQATEASFALDTFNGWVEDVDHVAGFVEHRVRFPEDWNGSVAGVTEIARLDVPENNWVVNRLQLVSLLMHDRPVVYDSTQLPDMRNASSVPVRELDTFESAALERLRAGEPLVVHSTRNRIAMLGPIRRFHDCADCHNAPENALLGAFSWELLRVPPLADPEPQESWNSQ